MTEYCPGEPASWTWPDAYEEEPMKEPDIFDLDKDALDEEWIAQPRLYHEHAEKLADARTEWERNKSNLEVVEAELDKDIRLNPSKYELEKITEPVVEKTIALQSRHQKAKRATTDAKHKVDLIQAVVDALDHRKKALENLVQLRLANYFSEPRVKGEAGRAMKEAEEDKAFSRRRGK